MFGNPVAQAYIRPPGSPNVYGNFRVTAAFGAIDADHSTPHQGVDIGNQKCGEPVLAMADGTVSLAGFLGSAKVVRIAHPQFGLESGYAHLATILVVKGQIVKRGQRIGTLGSTGANACHLHIGMKRNGVEIDSWPLLDQNGADMIPIPGANYTRLANKKSTLKYNGNFRDERKNGVVLQLFPQGTIIYPFAYANDGDVPTGSQSAEWFGCILYVKDKGNMFGWFHSSLVNPLIDDVAATDCTAAVNAAVAPLNLEITNLKGQLTNANGRIALIKTKTANHAADVAND